MNVLPSDSQLHATLSANNNVTPLTLSPRGARHSDSDHNFWGGSLIIVGLVILLVGIIVLASFWASDDEERLNRQRTYARVDDLYFSTHGIALTKETLSEIRRQRDSGVDLSSYLETFITTELKVTSLSLGGCAIKSEKALIKGEHVLIKLSELPDYPSNEHIAVFRVAWVREPKHPERDPRFSAGLQMTEILSNNNLEPLKKYMSYLLDEPST